VSDLDLKLLSDEEGDSSLRFGRLLLSRVALALKLSVMHDMKNAALTPPIKSLVEAIGTGLGEAPELRLQAVGENFFLNREIIKLDFSSYEAGQSLRTMLRRVSAQEITFTAQPGEVGLRHFLTDFQKYAQSQKPAAILEQQYPSIKLRAISKAEEESLQPTFNERKNLVRAYAHLALVIEQQLALMKAKRQARLAKVRRAIHGLSDACEGHETLLLALTRFEAFSGEVRFHLAATTAMTLLLAKRLDLNRVELSEACLAAAFHDLALDELPPPRDQQRDLSEELQALERVPLRTILRMCEGALQGDALERIAVAHEHTRKPSGPVGFGQLVAIPCVFDRLTRPRPPRKGLLPDHALRIILNQAGTRFDARLVQLFAQVIGLYPVGTTVKLNSGELAIVLEVPAQPALFARPRIKIIRTTAGPADHLVDLGAPGERRAIVSSVDPVEVDVNVPQFLLA
jgi:HD-GYP domain-containing protein (c-di-GMP phosphodiesterase class II)